jgi:HAE1 family hydrophobic/amphiphilic exporter-1
VDLTNAVTEALANRPELEQNTVAQEINTIDQRYYREQTKPQVDLSASYSASGIAGQQNPDLRIPFNTGGTPIQVADTLTGGYTSSVSDIFSNRYPTFRVGVTINLPFESKTAKAQLGRSLVEGERVKTQREQLEQAIQVDVRNALQLVARHKPDFAPPRLPVKTVKSSMNRNSASWMRDNQQSFSFSNAKRL